MRVSHCLVAGSIMALASGCFKERNMSIEVMNQGVEATRAKAYDTAVRKFKEATQLDPSNHLAWAQMGIAYKDQKKWPEAASAFAEATKIESDNADYHYELGNAYQESGKLENAKTEYEAAIRSKSLYKAHYRLGTVLQALDKPKEADSEYRKAIEINPRFAQAYIRLGYLYFDHDYDKESVQVFQNGVLANDNDGECHLGLGLALQKTKQYEEAIKEFKKAYELSPDLFLAQYNIGITYKMMDDKKNAREWLQKFITGAGTKGGADLVKAASDAMYQLDAP